MDVELGECTALMYGVATKEPTESVNLGATDVLLEDGSLLAFGGYRKHRLPQLPCQDISEEAAGKPEYNSEGAWRNE